MKIKLEDLIDTQRSENPQNNKNLALAQFIQKLAKQHEQNIKNYELTPEEVFGFFRRMHQDWNPRTMLRDSWKSTLKLIRPEINYLVIFSQAFDCKSFSYLLEVFDSNKPYLECFLVDHPRFRALSQFHSIYKSLFYPDAAVEQNILEEMIDVFIHAFVGSAYSLDLLEDKLIALDFLQKTAIEVARKKKLAALLLKSRKLLATNFKIICYLHDYGYVDEAYRQAVISCNNTIPDNVCLILIDMAFHKLLNLANLTKWLGQGVVTFQQSDAIRYLVSKWPEMPNTLEFQLDDVINAILSANDDCVGCFCRVSQIFPSFSFDFFYRAAANINYLSENKVTLIERLPRACKTEDYISEILSLFRPVTTAYLTLVAWFLGFYKEQAYDPKEIALFLGFGEEIRIAFDAIDKSDWSNELKNQFKDLAVNILRYGSTLNGLLVAELTKVINLSVSSKEKDPLVTAYFFIGKLSAGTNSFNFKGQIQTIGDQNNTFYYYQGNFACELLRQIPKDSTFFLEAQETLFFILRNYIAYVCTDPQSPLMTMEQFNGLLQEVTDIVNNLESAAKAEQDSIKKQMTESAGSGSASDSTKQSNMASRYRAQEIKLNLLGFFAVEKRELIKMYSNKLEGSNAPSDEDVASFYFGAAKEAMPKL